MGACVGRHREIGERYPGGKLKRRKSTKPDIEPISPTLWQRIKQHGKQLGADPRLSTELGRLHLHGEFTVAMTVAGFRIGEIYLRYESFKRLRRTAKSPSYGANYGDTGIAEELLSIETIEELERRIHEAERSWQATDAEIPRELRGPTQDLCVEDKAINPVLYEDMRLLLARFALAWRVNAAPNSLTPAGSRSAGGAGRAGPPLHFNKHEAIDAVENVPTVSYPIKKRPNFERLSFIRVARGIAPHLSDERLGEAFDLKEAFRQREILRHTKDQQGAKVIVLRPKF